ncbi:MAG TPA: phospholipase D-like domain-containing protein [Vicinamibacterales bacterium]|nr:phospholipase D-like domain-containing protein [Vicinamibacterales bacterium]
MKLIIQPEAGIVPIVKAIKTAKKSIDIMIFRFDRDEIEKALASAVQRGVTVRALIAHTNRGGEITLRKLEQRLLATGVLVSRTADDLLRYHAKYMVADSVLHLFGFNFTKLDIDKSRSFAISTKDGKAVAEAVKLFESDLSRQTYVPGKSHLVVSPDNSRAMLSTFICGARKELAIYDGNVKDPSMIKLLKERAAKGVKVRIIGSMKGRDPLIAERRLAGLRLHVRAIVRDGTSAFVGSQSLRKDELENRREVGLIINNPTVAKKLLSVFDTDWQDSKKGAKEKDKDAKDKDTKAKAPKAKDAKKRAA